ncbi:oligosaccharide flippase family protein [Acinetobacter sp. YH01025]|uniref:oligosaccharide flippase family protein n=1 Tax=Acinetobacter sp. YH01025 TaxID=2601038 RepID=UPI0015D1D97D|nr:oligosaccharide flippase family protein [Acinetobacter sp. YH01025]
MWSLLNKAKWLLSGNILFAFSQWLMLIMFSHFSSPMQLGYYSYALAITAPIFMLSNLQLRPLVVADFNLEKKFSFSEYLSLRLMTILLAILISLFFVDWENNLALSIVLAVVLIKASESVSDIIYAYYNANKKTKFISRSLTFKSVLVILLSFCVLYITHNIVYSLAATLIGYLFVLGLLDIRQNINHLREINFFDKKLIKIMQIGLPLGVAVMLVSLQTNIPRYFLEHYSNVELVGVYTILYYFIVIGGIAINSVCQYLSPNFSEFYRDLRIEELKGIIKNAFLIALSLGVSGLVVSLFLNDFIIKIIYGKDYLAYAYLLPYIMIAGIFTYLSVVNGYLLTSLKLLKIQMPVFLILVCLTVIYSYLLIPVYGLTGAIYTTILSAVSQFLISSFIIYTKIQELTRDV